MTKFSSSVNKLDKLLRPFIRSMVGQPTSFDFREALDSGKIIISKLHKGKLGSLTTSIIGSIIMAQMSMAAMQRSKRTKSYWFVDELQNFTHAVDIPSVVAELRKYGISLVSAFQNLDQIPYLNSLFGNCSNIISYRMGGADAKLLATEFGSDDYAPAIVELPDRAFYASLLRNGSPTARKDRA
jgi:type IV secretory pathway TraG/TraD family ATPase VirD4